MSSAVSTPTGTPRDAPLVQLSEKLAQVHSLMQDWYTEEDPTSATWAMDCTHTPSLEHPHPIPSHHSMSTRTNTRAPGCLLNCAFGSPLYPVRTSRKETTPPARKSTEKSKKTKKYPWGNHINRGLVFSPDHPFAIKASSARVLRVKEC
eukprot:NODE_1202_length_957_cov_86.979518_g1157_i0.p1 GENE.NODE_1202_length_957_cov_86.979518_g1157_i0~~NODE_1202_length_957_cov_86.979518_g1157_i0.p1  ORF type:complete len:149 (+),score=14.31 NODE_1202_length_957_cov_86.979518_g1157_i0:82-528(+)